MNRLSLSSAFPRRLKKKRLMPGWKSTGSMWAPHPVEVVISNSPDTAESAWSRAASQHEEYPPSKVRQKGRAILMPPLAKPGDFTFSSTAMFEAVTKKGGNE